MLDKTLPTVIFCNPNAGSYEFINLQSEYLQYYTQNGVNVVLWNYRGFGRSQKGCCGLLSMKRFQTDGEHVARHVRSTLVTGKVGIHGVSLGGSIASYIASKVQVDMLFVDRSFQSLQHVALALGGKPLLWAFKLFTFGGFTDNGLQNYNNI